MRGKSNFVPMVIILVCAIAVGLLVGWLAVRSPQSAPVSVRPVADPKVLGQTNELPVVEATTIDPPELVVEVEPVTAENWEDRVHDILADETKDEDWKADKLADMIPGLPEPAQVDIAEHLVNLVSDDDYKKKTSSILLSASIPGSVSGVLLHDLLNRSDSLRLPLTLEIAKNKDHPLRAEALETLEMSLVEDFGEDWDKWQKAIKESLKEQGLPDETEPVATQP